MPSIQPDDRAPDCTLPTHTGQQVSLADYRGKHVVVLYFYRPERVHYNRWSQKSG
jgi:peroxiredoxin